MELEVEDIPSHTRPYVVARLQFGRLFYYDSYLTKEKAELTVDRLGNAMIIEKGK